MLMALAVMALQARLFLVTTLMVTAAVLMLMVVVIVIVVVVVLHQMVDTGQVQDDDIGIKAASMHKLVLFLDRLPPKRSQCLFLNSRMWRCLDKK